MNILPQRQVHLDFHTTESIDGIGSRFDKKQFQSCLKKGHVNSITVFAKCHHGYCYYPTQHGTQHPTMTPGQDLTGEEVGCLSFLLPVYAGGEVRSRVKEKSIKFRCSQEEYDLLNEERERCGVNMTSFIRGKVFREGNRIIRNPELVTAIREVNQEITRVCPAVNQLMAGSPSNDQTEDLKKHLALVEHLESKIIEIISEELKDGNHETAPP